MAPRVRKRCTNGESGGIRNNEADGTNIRTDSAIEYVINLNCTSECSHIDYPLAFTDIPLPTTRTVRLTGPKKTLLESLDLYSPLRRFLNRSLEKDIAGIALCSHALSYTAKHAKRFNTYARYRALRIGVSDKILSKAEAKVSTRKHCTCVSRKVAERYWKLWDAKLSAFEEDQSPYKIILLASLPIVVSLFISSCYSLVDTLIVARYNGTREVASILNFLPFEQIITLNTVQALSLASASQISVELGARNMREVETIFSLFFIMGCCVVVLIPLTFLPLLRIILPELGVIPTYLDDVLRFGYVIISFMSLCNLLGVAMTPILRCENKTILVMLRQLVGTVINIILDLIFVILLKLNNVGAATATVISTFISGVWITAHFFLTKKKRTLLEQSGKLAQVRPINFNLSALRYSRRKLLLACRIIGLSISSYIQLFLLNFGALLSLILHKYWMPESIAHVRQVGVSIAARTTVVFSSPISGFQNGILPILGYNVGHGSHQRVYEISKAGLIILLVATTCQLILFQSLAPYIIRMYDLDDDYITSGIRALRIINAVVPMLSFSTFALTLLQVRKMQYRALGLQLVKVAAQISWQLFVPYIERDSRNLVAAIPFSDGVVGLVGLIIVIRELKKMRARAKQELKTEIKRRDVVAVFDDPKRTSYVTGIELRPMYIMLGGDKDGDKGGDVHSLNAVSLRSYYEDVPTLERTESSAMGLVPSDHNLLLEPRLHFDVPAQAHTNVLHPTSGAKINIDFGAEVSDMSVTDGESLPFYYVTQRIAKNKMQD